MTDPVVNKLDRDIRAYVRFRTNQQAHKNIWYYYDVRMARFREWLRRLGNATKTLARRSL